MCPHDWLKWYFEIRRNPELLVQPSLFLSFPSMLGIHPGVSCILSKETLRAEVKFELPGPEKVYLFVYRWDFT